MELAEFSKVSAYSAEGQADPDSCKDAQVVALLEQWLKRMRRLMFNNYLLLLRVMETARFRINQRLL